MKKTLLLILGLFFLSSVKISGVEKKGVSLSPPFADIELKSSDSEYQYQLEIDNKTDKSVTLDLSVIDFGSLDESGGVAFLTTNSEKDQKKYSLASWLSLEKSEVTIDPDSKSLVKVTVINKESLSPGGHYGAVLATLKAEVDNKGDVVGINQSLATLLYVQKIGGEKKSLLLKNVEWKNNGFFLIKNVNLRFENNGNVHLVPRGKIEIANGWGKLVGKGVINGDSLKILPESFRKIEVRINPLSTWRWPGKYSLEIYYRYDSKADFTKYKTSFIYFGFEGVILVSLFGVLVAALILGILNKKVN